MKKTKWSDPVKVVKQGEEGALLYLYHNDPTAGHLGEKKIMDRLKRNFFWPNMRQDIKEYIQTCYRCQMQGRPNNTEPTFALAPVVPWERVGVDFIGPLPVTDKGNRYIITAIDYFPRWPEAKAVSNATAETAVEFLYEEIICRYGLVKYFHTDRGTHFNNELMQLLTEKFRIQHHQVTAYHPQANGLIK